MGTEFPTEKIKKVLEKDSADGCTTTWMYLMPQCTPKNGKFYVYFTTVKEIQDSNPLQAKNRI